MNNRECDILNLLTLRLQRLQQVAWKDYQSPLGAPALVRDLSHSCVLLHRLAKAFSESECQTLIGWTNHSQADNSKEFFPQNSFQRDIPAFILTDVIHVLQNSLIYDRQAVINVLVAMHNTALNYLKELGFVPSEVITVSVERDALANLETIKGIT